MKCGDCPHVTEDSKEARALKRRGHDVYTWMGYLKILKPKQRKIVERSLIQRGINSAKPKQKDDVEMFLAFLYRTYRDYYHLDD